MKTITHQFYDGRQEEINYINEEFPYPEGQLIISRTDLAGNITHFNQAFVILSGYTREELLKQQHSILRHPDMPRAAFKGLWDTVQAGKKWHGYVKNLRKDGRFYWVYATVVPNYHGDIIEGYTSVRRQPSREKIAYYTEVYKKLLEEEKENG